MLPDPMRGVASGNAARPTAWAAIPEAHPRTRGTGPSHIPYRRAGEAPATPKPWRPASCGDLRPETQRPAAHMIPGTPPEGATARAPPRASRKRAQIAGDWCRLP